MRMWKGQKLVRARGDLNGALPCGTVVTVKTVIDEEYIELEGYEDCHFLRSQFEPLDTYGGEIRQMSDLELLEMSLRHIDHWNRTHPISQMISIEAYPAQDGGSLFTTHGFDSNSIGELIGHLLVTASNEERAAALEKAARALRKGL